MDDGQSACFDYPSIFQQAIEMLPQKKEGRNLRHVPLVLKIFINSSCYTIPLVEVDNTPFRQLVTPMVSLWAKDCVCMPFKLRLKLTVSPARNSFHLIHGHFRLDVFVFEHVTFRHGHPASVVHQG